MIATHYLETDDLPEFEARFELDLGRDGIGHYEAWGHRFYDAGQIAVTAVRVLDDNLTPEQLAAAEAFADDRENFNDDLFNA